MASEAQHPADDAGAATIATDTPVSAAGELDAGAGLGGGTAEVDDAYWAANPHFGGFSKKPEAGTEISAGHRVRTFAGIFAMRGMRPTMEDHHVAESFDDIAAAAAPFVEAGSATTAAAADSSTSSIPSEGAVVVSSHASVCAAENPKIAYFGVFDGHGGHRASQFVSQRLRPAICSSPAFAEGDIERAIRDGFATVETLWMQRAYAENMEDGTTAVVALVVDRVLWIANVGDSEAILSRAGVPTVLSIPHNAKANKLEERRVIHAGGKVRRARLVHPIWAVLNIGVTRSIGASAMKEGPNTDGRPSGLIAVPDINCVPLTVDDEFLILACDGLWDVMTPLEAADYVRHGLSQSGATAETVACSLVNRAFEKGSLDNITAVVVVFNFEAEAQSAGAASGTPDAAAAPMDLDA
eukprot:Amastigsp_a841277_294.p2 type:complete len:412 gc:universal Amastigsp_a841277_294:93-1328(+)